MHPSERLAAFLADELTADERRALEAELARDGRLRAQLAAMRRADAALASEPRSVLPDGARDRLLAALAPTLDDQLGVGEPADPAGSADPVDEFAARRRRTVRRRAWLAAAGGVAAAVLAVAVVAPDLRGFSGASDSASEESAEVAMDTGADDSAGGEAADDAASTSALPPGPVLTGGDRPLDAAGADALLTAPELDAVVDRRLAVADAAELGGDWAQAFGASPGAAAAGPAPSDDVPAEEREPVEEGEATEEALDAPGSDVGRTGDGSAAELTVGPDVGQEGRADVGRCLEALLTTGDTVVPVTAELVTFDGEPAIAYGLVGLDGDGTVARREVWVLARESCEVRYFTQS